MWYQSAIRSHSSAPTGYLSVRKMENGREIRTVEIDPKRGPPGTAKSLGGLSEGPPKADPKARVLSGR